METKWMRNGVQGGPDGHWEGGRLPEWFWEPLWRHVALLWLHFESQMGTKWEPKVFKTAIKNASEFEVDFEMHF